MLLPNYKLLLPAMVLFAALQVQAQNLVANGDFEEGLAGWNNRSGGEAVAAYSLETAAPFQGSKALKAEVTALGSNSWDAQSLGPSLTTTVGVDYVMTFYARAAVTGTQLRMVVQNNVFLKKDFTLSTNWEAFTWTFTAQEATPQLKIHYFQMGTFWIDDISVVPPANHALALTIQPQIRHQEMLGFGGALTWFSPRVLTSPHSANIKQLIYEDLGLDVVRFKNWYHPDNYPTDKSTQNLPGKFGFDATKTLADELRTANPGVRLLLSSWSPPISLKSNGQLKNGGTLASNADGYRYDELGQYWVDLLDNLGWTPDYISFQNEPGIMATWESCAFRPTETSTNAGYDKAADAIHLAIKDRPDAPVMIGAEGENIGNTTWNDWSGSTQVNTFRAMSTPLLSRPYFGAYAYHIYNITDESKIDGVISQMHIVRDEFSDRPNFMTEFSRDNLDWLAAARAIHNTVVEANTSAYIYWKLVWDINSPESMIGIASDGNYTVGPHYYMLKQYSKHVSQGHERIEVTGGTGDVKVSGFLNPAGTEITLVVLNKAGSPEEVQLTHDALPVSGAAAWQSITGSFYQDLGAVDIASPQILPAESMTTYVVSLSTTLNGLNTERFHLFDPVFKGNTFSVKVPLQPGIQYSLWKSPNLQADSWLEVTAASQSVEDGVVVFTDPDPGAAPHFYRVQAEW